MNDAELAEKRYMADAALRRAIELHAEAYHLDDDDEMLNVFAIVCHWTKDTADGFSRYTTHFHTPVVPGYVARGLFATGLAIVDAEGIE